MHNLHINVFGEIMTIYISYLDDLRDNRKHMSMRIFSWFFFHKFFLMFLEFLVSKSLTLYVFHGIPLKYGTIHAYRADILPKPLVFSMLTEFGVYMGMSQT